MNANDYPGSLVTVAVTSHNREQLLPPTLDSVLAQSFKNWECILVDDHSTDGSLQVANAYAARDGRFRIFSLPDPFRGPSAGRNFALEQAQGEFINYLDSDDLLHPQKLECHLQSFRERPELDFNNCRYATFEADLEALSFGPYPPPEQDLEYLLLGQESISPWQSGCPMWRTARLRELGGWEETLSWGEDLELLLRAAATRLTTFRIEDTLYFLRRGDQLRLSRRPRLEKENQRRRLYLKTWPLLEASGRANSLRRHLCAANLFRRALALGRQGKPLGALKDFVADSRSVGESWKRTILGCSLLTCRFFNALTPLAARLKRPYFAHRRELLPPLPAQVGRRPA